MKVLIFGQLTEVTTTNEVDIANVTSTHEIKNALLNIFPLLAEKKFVMAVNKKIIRDDVAINEHDEVALLPPFSGG